MHERKFLRRSPKTPKAFGIQDDVAIAVYKCKHRELKAYGT
jgi:hypothetical protein